MNIFILNIFISNIFLIGFLNNVTSTNSNCAIRIKNNYLKLLLLSDKRNIKIFKELKNLYKNSYYKAYSSLALSINNYNNLTEDDKTIIETIISLCY